MSRNKTQTPEQTREAMSNRPYRRYGRLLALALCVVALALAIADWLGPGHTAGIEWLALGMAIVGAILGGVSTFWRVA